MSYAQADPGRPGPHRPESKGGRSLPWLVLAVVLVLVAVAGATTAYLTLSPDTVAADPSQTPTPRTTTAESASPSPTPSAVTVSTSLSGPIAAAMTGDPLTSCVQESTRPVIYGCYRTIVGAFSELRWQGSLARPSTFQLNSQLDGDIYAAQIARFAPILGPDAADALIAAATTQLGSPGAAPLGVPLSWGTATVTVGTDSLVRISGVATGETAEPLASAALPVSVAGTAEALLSRGYTCETSGTDDVVCRKPPVRIALHGSSAGLNVVNGRSDADPVLASQALADMLAAMGAEPAVTLSQAIRVMPPGPEVVAVNGWLVSRWSDGRVQLDAVYWL